MKPEDRYHRFVRRSDEDQCYIGYCPDLYYGGCCHGEQEEDTYADLCAIVRDDWVPFLRPLRQCFRHTFVRGLRRYYGPI
jgi:hypothetical protein